MFTSAPPLFRPRTGANVGNGPGAEVAHLHLLARMVESAFQEPGACAPDPALLTTVVTSPAAAAAAAISSGLVTSRRSGMVSRSATVAGPTA